MDILFLIIFLLIVLFGIGLYQKVQRDKLKINLPQRQNMNPPKVPDIAKPNDLDYSREILDVLKNIRLQIQIILIVLISSTITLAITLNQVIEAIRQNP